MQISGSDRGESLPHIHEQKLSHHRVTRSKSFCFLLVVHACFTDQIAREFFSEKGIAEKRFIVNGEQTSPQSDPSPSTHDNKTAFPQYVPHEVIMACSINSTLIRALVLGEFPVSRMQLDFIFSVVEAHFTHWHILMATFIRMNFNKKLVFLAHFQQRHRQLLGFGCGLFFVFTPGLQKFYLIDFSTVFALVRDSHSGIYKSFVSVEVKRGQFSPSVLVSCLLYVDSIDSKSLSPKSAFVIIKSLLSGRPVFGLT